jgi:hypothetical protein
VGNLTGLFARRVSARAVNIENLAHERGFPEAESDLAVISAIGQPEIGQLQMVDVNPKWACAPRGLDAFHAESIETIEREFRIIGSQEVIVAQQR